MLIFIVFVRNIPVKVEFEHNTESVSQAIPRVIDRYQVFIFIQIFASREFPHELDRVNETLSNTNNDWEKRVDAVRFLCLS